MLLYAAVVMTRLPVLQDIHAILQNTHTPAFPGTLKWSLFVPDFFMNH
jgi:hypothetical protein